MSLCCFLTSGDSAVLGEIEEDLDEKVDYEQLKAKPLNVVIH